MPTSGQSPAADSSGPPVSPAVLAVYGDGYAAGNGLGGVGKAGWPALVAAQTGTVLHLHAVPRAGYAAEGATGQRFVDLVQDAPEAGAAVTILFGSRNDIGQDPAAVQANAAKAITTVRKNAPTTSVLVIGPVWSSGAVPAGALTMRDAVSAAARSAGATFVDPLKAGWFADQAALIASDGVSPTDAGHSYLARQMIPDVQSALAASASARPAG